MRAGFATVALALASGVSAAIVAVEASFRSATAIELEQPSLRHAIAQTQPEDSTSTTTTTSTSTTWETITVTLASASPSSSTSSSRSVATSSSSSSTPVAITRPPKFFQDIAEDEITSTIVETVEVTVIAQPIITTYANPSAGAGWIGRHAGGTDLVMEPPTTQLAAPPANRDGVITQTLSQFTTSTIPASITTTFVTRVPPPAATGTSYRTLAPGEKRVTTSLPPGVAVVTSTALITVTSGGSSGISLAAASGAGVISSLMPSNTTCTTSTTSWLNISTFVATPLANWTASSDWSFANSNSTTSTLTSTIMSTSSPAQTTTKPPTSDEGPFKGAVTSPIRNGSGKAAESGEFPVVTTVAAMAACLTLALML
ncbi:uncharacterized protein LTR77_005643 [Saxophila tyrrhenica]|uniref:Uncharacterized protein n=1 Tax=Saxophila tyrrhenica TaxID=1690608 RepID=A0AAV9P9V0_9PEZI|nr:hypothetical protein LTR77_005643 [Saxophila tyrrhenica]